MRISARSYLPPAALRRRPAGSELKLEVVERAATQLAPFSEERAALEEDERHLAEDKELFAKKDAEIEGLKKRSGERRVAAERLGNLQKEHEALKSDRDKTHKELEDAKVRGVREGCVDRGKGKLCVGYEAGRRGSSVKRYAIACMRS